MSTDLANLTDDELDALRVAVLTEQERRANLAVIPEQVADLATKYRDGGGNTDDLKAVIDGD